MLKLRSSSSGTQWNINPQSTSVSYVDVQDSNNANATVIAAASSTNSGDNTNWNFYNVGNITVDAQSVPVTFGAVGSPTYTVTVNRGTGGGIFSVTLSTSTLPADLTAQFTSSSLSFGISDNSKSTTLTLTTTGASTPSETIAFSVHAASSSSSADSATGNGTLTVNQASTTTTVTSSLPTANQTAFDSTSTQPVTFTATVHNTANSATPAGRVTFEDAGTPIGTGTLSGSGSTSTATFTTSSFSVGATVGTHSITAVYNGDATNSNFGSSPSTSINEVIRQYTTTTVTSTPNPSVLNYTVTFTATVIGTTTTPDGTVTFEESAISLGTGSLSGSGTTSTATFTYSGLIAGTHTITAVYNGDTSNSAASSGDDSGSAQVVYDTLTWTGAEGNNTWSNPNNWAEGVAPVDGLKLDFGGNATTTMVDDMPGLSIEGIRFDVSSYILDGSGNTTLYIGSDGIYDAATAGTNTLTGNITITLTADPIIYVVNAGETLVLNDNINTGDEPLFIEGAGNTTINGQITGNGSLTKEDTGTLLLNANNTYTGNTTISAGTIQDGAENALPTGTILTVNANGTLDLNGYNQQIGGLDDGGDGGGGNVTNSNTTTTVTLDVYDDALDTSSFSGTISDSGTSDGQLRLYKEGPGTLTLSGTNSYAGGTTIYGGTLSISGDSNLGNTSGVGVTIFDAVLEVTGNTTSPGGFFLNASTSTIQVDGSKIYTIGGQIDGLFGALNKTGTGTLVLGAVNSYSGSTTVEAGTLQDGNVAGALPAGTSLILGDGGSGSGTFDLNGYDQTVASIATSGNGTLNTITDSGGAATLTVTGSSSFSGNITGNNTALTVADTGTGQTLTLSGNNTFGGATTISANDTLQAGSTTALSSATSVSDNGILDLNGENISIGALNGGGSVINTGSPATLTVTSSGTFTGNITGANTALTVAGGTLTLSGTNTFSGNTTINSGDTLKAGSSTALTGNTSVSDAGTLDLNGNNTSIGALNGVVSGVVTNSGSSATLTVTGGGSFSGNITGNTTGLTVGGSGQILVLSGTNTFGGATTISANDTLQANSTTALSSNTNVSDAGTLDLNGNSIAIGALNGDGSVISGSPATLTVTGGGTFTGNITGNTTGLTVGGSGQILILSGTNTFGGATTISANDTLQANSTTALTGCTSVSDTGTLDLNGKSISIGTLNGAGSVINSASLATLTVTSGGSFSGNITGANTALTVAGGTLTLSGDNTFSGNTTIDSGDTLKANSTTALSSATNVSDDGTLDLAGYSITIGSLTGTGRVIDSGGPATLIVTGGGTFSGNITGNNTALTVGGTAMLTLNGTNNSYNGNTTVNANATLQVGVANTVPSTSDVTVNGTLDLNGNSDTIGALSGGGLVTSTANGTLLLTVGATGNSGVFSGVIENGSAVSVALTKTGNGTLTLSGNNTYSGGTIIDSGVLSISRDVNLGNNTIGVTINQATLEVTGNTTSASSRGFTLGDAGSTIQVDGSSIYEIAGDIGGGMLNKTGTGTLLLAGSNNYGNTTISAGTIQAGTYNALPTGTIVTVNANGTLDLNGHYLQIGGLDDGAGGGGVVTNSSANTTAILDVNNAAIDSFSGTISDSFGTTGGKLILVKDGLGTLTLSGNNSYAGGTTIATGTLSIIADSNLGNTTGGVAIFDAVLEVNGNTTSPRTFTLSGSPSTIHVEGSNVYTISGLIAGVGTLNKTGNGTLDLTYTNNSYGNTTISAGILQAGTNNALPITTSLILGDGGSGSGVFDLNGNDQTVASIATSGTGTSNVITNSSSTTSATLTVTGSSSFSGNIVGANTALTVAGGTLTLSGTNTFGGNTTINIGDTLQAGSGTALSGNTSVSDNGILDLDGKSITIGSLNGGGASSTPVPRLP